MKSTKFFIYGKHAVIAAVSNPNRKIDRIFIKEDNLELRKNIELLIAEKERNIKIKLVKNIFFEKMFKKNTKHQGLVAESYKLKIPDYTDIFSIENFKYGVILDRITDINNIGAIYRSAQAFNIDFIISSAKHSAEENSDLLNIACGAFEKVNTFSTNNISNAIINLFDKSWWIIGLEHQSSISLHKVIQKMNPKDKIIFVLGSEGKGIRKLIKKNCNFLVRIPNMPHTNSINVSNAAAIVFYENYVKNNK